MDYKKLARALLDTAAGNLYSGMALHDARNVQGITPEDRAVLSRWEDGHSTPQDRWALEDFANRILSVEDGENVPSGILSVPPETRLQHNWTQRVNDLSLELFTLPDDAIAKLPQLPDDQDYRSYLRSALEQTDVDGCTVKSQCIEAWTDVIGQFDWNTAWFVAQVQAIESDLKWDLEWEKKKLGIPKFKVGDIVSFVNSYGVKFPEKEVVGIESPFTFGQNGQVGYYLSPSDSPWFAVSESHLIADEDDPVVEICAGHKIRNITVEGDSWFLVGITKQAFAKLERAREFAEENSQEVSQERPRG